MHKPQTNKQQTNNKQTTNMQELMYELNLIKTHSNDLTLQFFSDLVRIQEEKKKAGGGGGGGRGLGELLLTAEYDRDKKALHVHVIQGKSLPVMDKAGAYDIFGLRWGWRDLEIRS